MMTSNQRRALLVTSLVGWTIGNGLLPILPVWAAELHISKSMTGVYLALSYVALLIGTLVAGLISDRLQMRRVPLMIVGLLTVPVIWGMGQATGFWSLLALTSAAWFLGGMGLAFISIVAGLFVSESERGTLFGLLALTSAGGALLGGATLGPIADAWGFQAMFAALAGFTVLMALCAWFLPDRDVSSDKDGHKEGSGALPRAFYLLMVAVFIASVARFMGHLATSLIMHAQEFSASAVSGTAAVGGLIALPLPALIGWLSDRWGRRSLLWVCYGAGVVGFVILGLSDTLGEFWTSAAFLAVLGYASMGVGSALVTDLAPIQSLGRALAAFNGLNLAGGIVGLALTGVALDKLGINITFGIGILVLALASSILLLVIPPASQESRNSDPAV